ncbi:uncharacterized protein LOC106051846 isoform X2 [Biomphalaria glabrata]|uniref:Uncharacterized protein LOC106051846 isoform X2 n=1 Tax=Biomphalaria glabrata TaxID=6526 RepID=A0A9W3A222_BIOGL|nr:uncharacterized protein LOC106051846 isoform X2 [Biomphalaria glabrata]
MSYRPNFRNFETIDEGNEECETATRRGSTTPLVKDDMALEEISLEQIEQAELLELIELVSRAGITTDDRLQNLDDIRDRLICIKRKQMGENRGAEINNAFASMHSDNRTKEDALLHLYASVEEIFQRINTDSLSAVLKEEGHLTQLLPHELAARMQILTKRKSTVIIAGETNGGKSSFLNLLLGENILPTDVLHCTYSVCRIMYSEKYSVHLLDYKGDTQVYECRTSEEARELLKDTVAREGVFERQQGSLLKEVVLMMPSPILKSGVTLVDTPGIGEDDNMDNVTMSFVKSTQASAFIYVIKSDTAGGVQEDRLIGFLRAIKQRYEAETMREYFDPLAAMFVCHRWDNIEESEREKVKQNALRKLEDVWPGFSPVQTFFFSTKNANKHLPLDPDFIIDSHYALLKGLKALFDRASYNAIKHQYIWLKHILQPASRHLKAMITHCIRGNEELEIFFHSLTQKQEILKLSSAENSRKLQKELQYAIADLVELVRDILDIEDHAVSKVDDFNDLLAECTKDNFLTKQANRHELDVMILRSLLKYVNRLVNESGAMQRIEQSIVQSIENHLGLFRCQIREIKNEILHGESRRETEHLDNPDSLNQSYSSTISMSSDGSAFEDLHKEITLDPTEFAQTISSLMNKRKEKKMKYKHHFNKMHEASQSLLGRFKDLVRFHDRSDHKAYLEKRVKKMSEKMREDDDILSNIVLGFVEWIKICVDHATESIPKFINVNTTLMENIREHREALQEDKEQLKMVMEELEPSRDHLKGFGSLYMEDINADTVDFALPDRQVSSVVIPKELSVSTRPLDDSGFQGSGSKHRKVKSLWGRLQLANITIDGVKEKVILKTYTYDLDEKHFFSEIACLRCLEDDNIGQFFGMTRIKTAQSGGATFGKAVPEMPIDVYAQKVSAFIFKGDLISARIYSANKMINKQEFIPTFVHSLLSGLKYIHREKLVHMELNLDTVMVDKETGNVKLCQMCKPREAKFPQDLTLVKTLSCVCLSPSVLQGDEYTPTDDIYAFGLLLWELLFPSKPPYKEQRDMLLKDFIEKCHPESMIGATLAEVKPSPDVESVIRGTVFTKRGTVCMSIDIIAGYLKDLRTDPAVKEYKPNTNIYRPRRKSSETTLTGRENQLEEKPGNNNQFIKNPPPVRPPRQKDAYRKEKATGQSLSQDDDSRRLSNNNSSHGRRMSEPAVMAANIMKLSELKGIKPQKYSKVLEKLVKNVSPNARRYSMFTTSEDEVFHMPEVSSILSDKQEKPSMTVRGMVNSRRFSLQDASLTVPKPRHNHKFSTIPDVPELMAANKLRFGTPFSFTLPHNTISNNSFTNLSFPGRLVPSDSLPCLVPSIEEQKNNFFSKDEKLADSWQSPVMIRKSYGGASNSYSRKEEPYSKLKSYLGKEESSSQSSLYNGKEERDSQFKAENDEPYSPVLQTSVHNIIHGHNHQNKVKSQFSCSLPDKCTTPDISELAEEDDTRPLEEDFSAVKETVVLRSSSKSLASSVRSLSASLGEGSTSSLCGKNMLNPRALSSSILSKSNSNKMKHNVSFKETLETMEPCHVGASNRGSSRNDLVAYSQSSEDDESLDDSQTALTPNRVAINNDSQSLENNVHDLDETDSLSDSGINIGSGNNYSSNSCASSNGLFSTSSKADTSSLFSNNNIETTQSYHSSAYSQGSIEEDENEYHHNLTFPSPVTPPVNDTPKSTPRPPSFSKLKFNFK